MMLRGSRVRVRGLHTAGLPITSPWVKDMVKRAVKLMEPRAVHVCDGSNAEAAQLIKVTHFFFAPDLCAQRARAQIMVASGQLEPLNPTKRPNSYLARSDPRYVSFLGRCFFWGVPPLTLTHTHTPATWRAWRSRRIFARGRRLTPAPTTTGALPKRCTRSWTGSSRAP